MLEELDGTLTLWAVNSSDLISSPSAQLYQGGYVAVNTQGDTICRRAAAVGEESQEATLFISLLAYPVYHLTHNILIRNATRRGNKQQAAYVGKFTFSLLGKKYLRLYSPPSEPTVAMIAVRIAYSSISPPFL